MSCANSVSLPAIKPPLSRRNSHTSYAASIKSDSSSSCNLENSSNSPLKLHRELLAEKLRTNWNDKGCLLDDLDESLTNLNWLHSSQPIKHASGESSHEFTIEDAINVMPPIHDECQVNNLANVPSEWPFPVEQLASGHDLYPIPSRHEYRTNPALKPPFSYATMICMAMRELGKAKIALSDIYAWMTTNFVYYRVCNSTWQNSVRHNLSLNKCFEKVPRRKDEPGKGGFWQVNPKYSHILESGIMKRRRPLPYLHSAACSPYINYSCDPAYAKPLDSQSSQPLHATTNLQSASTTFPTLSRHQAADSGKHQEQVSLNSALLPTFQSCSLFTENQHSALKKEDSGSEVPAPSVDNCTSSISAMASYSATPLPPMSTTSAAKGGIKVPSTRWQTAFPSLRTPQKRGHYSLLSDSVCDKLAHLSSKSSDNGDSFSTPLYKTVCDNGRVETQLRTFSYSSTSTNGQPDAPYSPEYSTVDKNRMNCVSTFDSSSMSDYMYLLHPDSNISSMCQFYKQHESLTSESNSFPFVPSPQRSFLLPQSGTSSSISLLENMSQFHESGSNSLGISADLTSSNATGFFSDATSPISSSNTTHSSINVEDESALSTSHALNTSLCCNIFPCIFSAIDIESCDADQENHEQSHHYDGEVKEDCKSLEHTMISHENSQNDPVDPSHLLMLMKKTSTTHCQRTHAIHSMTDKAATSAVIDVDDLRDLDLYLSTL